MDKREENKEDEEKEEEEGVEEEEDDEDSEEKKSKTNKSKEIKLKKNKEKKSSKSQSNKESLENKENNEETKIKNDENLIEKNSSNHSKRDSKNRFYIHQSNDRMLTLMDIPDEDYSYKNVNKKDEIIFLQEKIKFLEEKSLKLESMNKIYYDIIKDLNLDNNKNNNNNNNNTLQFQSFDNPNNNNISDIHQNYLNNLSRGNLDFAIQNFIDGERNKNIHNFNDSMIDINKKITNYLIDNCQEQKDKRRSLENFKYEIGQKLDRIEKIQLKQKHDIDFIIKYGLNKNRALDPVVGLLYDYQRPLPKLLKEIDEENKYDKVLNKKNLNTYKNFYLYGRYSNLDKREEHTDNKNRNSKILRRTGSCIFENRKNPFTYKLRENEVYNKENPNIKRPFFENKKKNLERNNRNSNIDYNEEDEEYQKFIAYKGKYFIPAEFRFCGQIGKNKEQTRAKRIKKEIDFII